MMNPQGEETIFAEALRLPAEERALYLAQATSGNSGLRQRIESLLGNYSAGDFLEQAAAPQLRPTLHVTIPLIEKPGDTIGRYKLLEQIGEGGCGVVYMAEQAEPVRRRLALKIIKLGMDTKSVIARFEAERQALALMDHPNIAKVFDAGATETGRPYFVMELVRGMKITEYCDEKKLSTRERLDLFTQVCCAIQHAHQKGIIHRDIKPSNILVSMNDGVLMPKVIDFGIAKATGGQQLTDKTVFTAFEQFIGTPAYMSPEQAVVTNVDIDTRSDIYALGVLLYELLTGKTPFDAKELLAIGLDEMRRTIREQEPLRPSTRLSTLAQNELSTTAQRRGLDAPKLVSELRGDLDWIVMKALEKDRARRYDTANSLASDVRRYLNNEAVTARPPSNLYQLEKLIRRNQLAFFAAIAVAGTLVVGVMGSAWQAQRAKAERDSAEAVLKFFQEAILAAGRPDGQEGGLGKDVTLRKAIDAAEPQIATAFQKRPVVEAAIRYTLGKSYSYLGERALAIQHIERALALRRLHLGLNHPDTLESLNGLGFEYVEAGEFERGLTLLENAFELRKRTLGPEHPATLDSVADLIVAYQQARKLREAITTGEQALKLSNARLGFEHPTTEKLVNNLSLAYMHSGKPEQAIALIEHRLNMCAVRLGPDHPQTLVLMHNLARCLSEGGQWQRAVPLYEEVFKLRRTKLGAKHPQTLLTMHWLAVGNRETGKTERALLLLQELLNIKTETLGPNHAETISTANTINETYRKAGKLEELEKRYRAQLEQQTGDVVSAGFELGRLLLETSTKNDIDPSRADKRAREGQQLLREYLARARTRYTNDPLALGWKLSDAAEMHYRLGNYVEAEPLYRELLQCWRAAWGMDNHYVLGAMASLARLFTDWAWAEHDVETRGAVETPRPTTREVTERAYEAERLLREVLAGRLRNGTNSWRIGDVQSRLGGALVSVAVMDSALDAEDRRAKLTEAEFLLLKGYEQVQNATSDAKYKRDALRRLVRLYETWHKPDKLAEWRQKLDLLDHRPEDTAGLGNTDRRVIGKER